MKLAPDTHYVHPEWLDRDEYPFKPYFLRLPAGRMHFVDEGEGDPVVLLHGNPVWSFVYRNVIKGISGTYRCIAPDHLGFGLSDKPADWDYLPEQHAQNLEALIRSLKLERITMVVNDWGGPIGLSYALRYPEKIKKLVILNTWMWSVSDDKYYINFSNIMGGGLGRFLNKHFNVFAHVVVKKAFGDAKKLTPAIHRHYYLQQSSPAERKGVYVFPRQIVNSGEWLDGLWRQRERINHLPTTFIWGMKDIAFREKELNYFIANWHASKVIKLDHVGHYPEEEEPGVIVAELLGTR